jgi:hypothetical protein
VFGTDESDCEKVAKWERACEPIVERWASAIQKGASLEEVDNLSAERNEKTYWEAVERAIGNTRLMPNRKPRFLTAKGSVPCPADLIGAFVGKAGATIRALEHRLGARQMDRKTGRPRGHFHSRIVLTVNEDRTISFVAPACRAADVEASIRAQIETVAYEAEFRLRAFRERRIQRAIRDAEGCADEPSYAASGAFMWSQSCEYESVKEQARIALHNAARHQVRKQCPSNGTDFEEVNRKYQPRAIGYPDDEGDEDEDERADVLAARRSSRKSVRSQTSLGARGGVQQGYSALAKSGESGNEEKVRRRGAFEARKGEKKAKARAAAQNKADGNQKVRVAA